MPWSVPKPVLMVGAALLLLGIVFLLGRCTGSDNEDVKAQVEQTNRSGEAISNAAEVAIEIIGDRAATEAAINQAVDQAVKEIDRAESADAVRSIVVNRLCGRPEYRFDSACQLRETDPD